MARKSKQIELTLNDGVDEEQNIVESRSDQELTVAERLAEYLTQDGCECVSRIYREDRRNPSQVREFLERVDYFVEEEYLADKWGGGSYVVRYQYKKDGERKSTSLSFRISDIYKGSNVAAPTVAAPATKTGFLGDFLQDLTTQKVAGMVALVEGVKKIFAPSIDMTEVLKLAAAPRTPSIGEAVVLKALEGVNKPAQVATPAPSIIAQIKEVAQIKELLGNNNNEDENRGGDEMSVIAKIALNLLPEILKKNNGNYEAAGASVKNNPAVVDALRADPELAGEFLNAVANSKNYGVEAAKKLALGFGYEFEPAPEQAADALPVTGESTNNEAAAAAQ